MYVYRTKYTFFCFITLNFLFILYFFWAASEASRNGDFLGLPYLGL